MCSAVYVYEQDLPKKFPAPSKIDRFLSLPVWLGGTPFAIRLYVERRLC